MVSASTRFVVFVRRNWDNLAFLLFLIVIGLIFILGR